MTNPILTRTRPSPSTNRMSQFEPEGGAERQGAGLAGCAGRSEEVPAMKKEEALPVKRIFIRHLKIFLEHFFNVNLDLFD